MPDPDSTRSSLRRRRALVTIALLVAVVVGGGIAIAGWVAHQRSTEYEAELQRDFNRVTTRLQRAVDRMAAHLSGAPGIVDGNAVSERRFQAFAEGIRSEDPVVVAALELAVDEDDRADFEALHGISIWSDTDDETGASGAAVPGGHYYPVVAVNPDDDESRSIVGLDIGTDPTRGEAAAAARDSGLAVATPPAMLPYSPKPGIIVVQPLYRSGASTADVEQRRDALVGFVSISYAVEALLAEAMEPTILLEDAVVLDGRHAADVPLPEGWEERPIPVGDSEWVVRARPEPAPRPWPSLAILAVALLVGGLLVEMVRRAWRYDIDLATSNDSLRIEQRRTLGLQSLTATLASAATVPDVARATLEQGLPLLGADAGQLEVSDETGNLIEVATVGTPGAPGTTPHLRPLTAYGESLGQLTVAVPDDADVEATEQMLAAVAALTGLAVARARRYDTEHQMVRALQSMLLPVLPARWGPIRLAATYQPVMTSSGVGGDWYDVLDTARGPAVVIGDVVGKGIRAAGVMGQLRIATRTMSDRDDPAAVLGSLDELALELADAWMTSVAYVVIDVAHSRIDVGIAGHPPPLLLQAGRPPLWLDESVGPPLGVESSKRTIGSIPFDGPARLLLYTDGLVERRGSSIDVGLNQLRDVAYGLIDLEGEEFLDRLVAEMAPPGDQQDDIAALCADLGQD